MANRPYNTFTKSHKVVHMLVMRHLNKKLSKWH